MSDTVNTALITIIIRTQFNMDWRGQKGLWESDIFHERQECHLIGNSNSKLDPTDDALQLVGGFGSSYFMGGRLTIQRR